MASSAAASAVRPAVVPLATTPVTTGVPIVPVRSASARVSVPEAASVASVSVSAAAARSPASTVMRGTSFAPCTVTVMSCSAVPPWLSVTRAVKVSVALWPARSAWVSASPLSRV